MSKSITILQIGDNDWSQDLEIPDNTGWFHCTAATIEDFITDQRETILAEKIAKGEISEIEDFDLSQIHVDFSAILLTSYVKEEQLEILTDCIEAYSLFYDDQIVLDTPQKSGIFRRKCLRQLISKGNRQLTVEYLTQNIFRGQYGAKLKVCDIDISPQFSGVVDYQGYVGVNFEGDFGEEFTPLYTFRYGFPSFEFGIEIWPEYIKNGDVELYWQIDAFQSGSLGNLLHRYEITEKDLKKPYVVQARENVSTHNVTVYAKGKGELRFGALHWRYSRMGLGQFVLGGRRLSDSIRQELAYYFNPGDMKPPLNVYFSGFRGAEGFEGFFMMKRLGAPFLLVADPRLEGGCFYMGTKELEEQLVQAIQDSLEYLGFDHSQLVLSGLSMGAFGALYYSGDLDPAAVIVGKPFTNLGDVVTRMKLGRPDEFETSSDMLANITGDNSNTSAQLLNERFWQKFKKATFQQTIFAIAYMKEDDYDRHAFEKLVTYTADKSIHLYGSGYTGRHNDNSRSINQWFISQYHRILRENFGRKL